MFIDPNEIIEIEIYYKKEGRNYKAYERRDFELLDLSKEERNKYILVTIQTRQLTWGLHNYLKRYATVNYKENGKIKEEWDNRIYREKKLKKIIIGWDAKNGKEDIPITSQNIINLAPEVGEAILKAYDKEAYIGDLEEKKIAGQINSYIMSNGRSSSGVSEAITESDLIEQFNWLPQDIAKIPYKNLQMLYLVMNAKRSSRSSKVEIDALKQKGKR